MVTTAVCGGRGAGSIRAEVSMSNHRISGSVGRLAITWGTFSTCHQHDPIVLHQHDPIVLHAHLAPDAGARSRRSCTQLAIQVPKLVQVRAQFAPNVGAGSDFLSA